MGSVSWLASRLSIRARKEWKVCVPMNSPFWSPIFRLKWCSIKIVQRLAAQMHQQVRLTALWWRANQRPPSNAARTLNSRAAEQKVEMAQGLVGAKAA